MAKDDLANAVYQLTTTIVNLNISLKGLDARMANVEANMATSDELRAEGITNEAQHKLTRKLIAQAERRSRKDDKAIELAISKVATTSPSIKMFDKLKAKVDRHHPAN